MSQADTLIHAWAAKQLDVPTEKIAKVEFVHVDGYAYSDITEEPAYDAAQVTFTEPLSTPDAIGNPTTYREISIDVDDLGSLLREIIEASE